MRTYHPCELCLGIILTTFTLLCLLALLFTLLVPLLGTIPKTLLLFLFLLVDGDTGATTVCVTIFFEGELCLIVV